MSYPDKYTRQFDYSWYQNANPSRPLPADKVNADLNLLARTSGETVDFLKGIARADGKIMNGAVGYDQLSAALQFTMNPTDGEALAAAVAGAEASAVTAGASAAASAASASAAAVSKTGADDAASAASVSASAAASSASLLGHQVHQYDTRALAEAATIPVGVTNVIIKREDDGWPLCNAPYIQGTIAGPRAFLNNGVYWQLDLSGSQFNLLWAGVRGGRVDDGDAIQLAADIADGAVPIFVPPASAKYLTSKTINVPRNTTFFSYTSSGSQFGAYGTGLVSPLLFDEDGGGFKAQRIGFVGNNVGVTGGRAGAFWMRLSEAEDTIDGPEFSDCYFAPRIGLRSITSARSSSQVVECTAASSCPVAAIRKITASSALPRR